MLYMHASTSTEVGKCSENAVAEALTARGLRVLARNVRRRYGEIDLVAQDRDTIVFVEVRARRRGALVPPEETVGWRKKRRIAMVAASFLACHHLDDMPCRLDVAAVEVLPDGSIGTVRLLENAFQIDWHL